MRIPNAPPNHNKNSNITREVTIQETEFGKTMVVRKYAQIRDQSGTDVGSIPFARLSFMVMPPAPGNNEKTSPRKQVK